MNWLATLNESQLKAVIHPGGPLFVVAGAGTGKTKTLTSRIAYLIMNGVEAKRILAVTFTNKAAREMKQRVIEMTGPHAMSVWLYTFHAFGLQILRNHIAELPYGYRPNFTVIDEDDGKKIIQDQIKELGLDTKEYSIRLLKNLISLYKSNRMDGFERTDEEKIYQKYQDYLKENQLLDFDDLLLYTLELLEEIPSVRERYQSHFEHVLVDEFQDTDAIQYKILKILGTKHKNVFVVGDPDQSIYAFRGANYENAKLFEKDFGAEKIILEQNYRSTNQILKAANQLIQYNFDRPSAKNLESDLGVGEPPIYHHAESDYRETFFVVNEIHKLTQRGYQYDDIAVLYRNNALSRLFEDSFIKSSIPYIIYGGLSFYERKEIKDAIAYIRVILDQSQDFYLKRIVNVPKRSIGLVSLQKLEQQARELGVSMFDAIDYVKVTPQAKGGLLEFKKLILEMSRDFSDMVELSQITPYLMEKTGYLEMLKAEGSEISDDRINNLRELQSVFTRGDIYYEGSFVEKLTEQLDQIALYTDQDQDVEEFNHVKLSTYHQVKGLEFKVVFMVVMEENIFPSDRVLMQPAELEEERRIAYVGITRAKEKLYMSYADKRMVYGSMRYSYPSRFIQESRVKLDQPKTIYEGDYVSHLLKQGDKVEHNVFGIGVVIRVDDDIATIAFAMPHGIKRILESHPAIRKIMK
ncbi:ATP-dependent helicase [Peloplasma aerotolerans]|uniref:DNA 3'-5' helicase n=1 Tax=Peloplasma aerotolerans TaxID=3044389 RepID=A0AAW6U5E9_9MOLU|nr:UvrD-helicase domain-containing protein [Mariniplasma sp. M4Ah]MDI6452140.1 UvrD-helicase domain-containing protein [Mariniplasma sp. M4Ah]